MTDDIYFDHAGGSFILRLKNSVYVLRILANGQVVYMGFTPLAVAASVRPETARLDGYGDADYERETRCLRHQRKQEW